MAIIDSVLVGKGRGKIGNVVLQGIKGQTVAKQLNPAPSNPRTVLQTESRVRMANTVAAWQFLSVFFAFAGALRKPLESVYNAFVRIYKNKAGAGQVFSRVLNAMQLLGGFQFAGNWVSITSIVLGVGTTKVNFTTGGLPFVQASTLRMIGIDLEGQAFTIAEHVLDSNAWNAGMYQYAGLGNEYTAVAAYIYTPDQSKISSLGYAEA